MNVKVQVDTVPSTGSWKDANGEVHHYPRLDSGEYQTVASAAVAHFAKFGVFAEAVRYLVNGRRVRVISRKAAEERIATVKATTAVEPK